MRLVMLLVAVLHGQAPAIRAATGACAAGTLAVAPVMLTASVVDDGAGTWIAGPAVAVSSPASATDAGDAPPAALATSCAPTLALAPPVSQLAATTLTLGTVPPPTEAERPSNHHPAPPFQPPRA